MLTIENWPAVFRSVGGKDPAEACRQDRSDGEKRNKANFIGGVAILTTLARVHWAEITKKRLGACMRTEGESERRVQH